MSDFDPYAYASADSPETAAADFDPYKEAAADGKSREEKPIDTSGNPIIDAVHAFGSQTYHNIASGIKGLYTLGTTGSGDKATQAVQSEQAKSYEAPPISYAGVDPRLVPIIERSHEMSPSTGLGDWASTHGAGPGLSTALAVLPTALASTVLAPRGLGPSPEEAPPGPMGPQPATAPTPLPAGSDVPKGYDTEPVEGGVSSTAQSARADVLRRVGLDRARQSAIEGNAKDAATDFQLKKFDEPAGIAASNQFDAERAALNRHAESIVDDTGGTIGTDEDTLSDRGRTIAKPFDQLSDWFDQQRKTLYGAADQRAAGGPVTNLEGTQALLDSPTFKNTLMAKDQGNLLSGVQNQLQEFRTLNPEGFSVANAEKVRQWLNTTWTNENKGTIGQIKSALDQDVLQGAGEDIYGPARALQQMKHQTLDNPEGIARLMDKDPQTPINRTTPYSKIPDTLTRLDPDQFQNVIKTLDTMPEEIQPAAQAAKSEIQAHLANKLLDAGSSTQGQWNSPAVTKVLKSNSAKFQIAFDDKPEVLSKIQDLDSAGRILKVDQGYPGAAAQAANALKRGFMSKAISKGAAATGALVGSGVGGVVGAPALGAGVGGAVGEHLGTSLGQGMSESAALKRWQGGVVPLTPIPKGRMGPPTP